MNSKSNQINSETRKTKKILLIGDSHVRGLGDLLRQRVPSNIQVETCCMPNAKFADITKNLEERTSSLKQEDVAFIMGGTNDITSKNVQPRFNYSPLLKLASSKKVVACEKPYRYDIKSFNHTI